MIAEYVSIAHPDRMADLMAAKLITYLQTSPSAHAAIEVMCVNKTVIFAGESNVKVNKKLLKKVVKEVMEDCGYERKMDFKDGVDYVSSKKIKIKNLINKQSEDIAKSTTDKSKDSGWNDQGIFFGSCDLSIPGGQNVCKFLSQSFGEFLFKKAKQSKVFGTDIKVLMEGVDFFIERVIIAIPCKKSLSFAKSEIKTFFFEWALEMKKTYGITVNVNPSFFEVNTSGIFVKHGMIADTGLTGRKTAINCLDVDYKNGGGSMIKPWHSADLLIPLYLRDLSASKYNEKSLMATTSIGTNFLNVFDFETEELLDVIRISPISIANAYNLFDGRTFYSLVKENFLKK